MADHALEALAGRKGCEKMPARDSRQPLAGRAGWKANHTHPPHSGGGLIDEADRSQREARGRRGDSSSEVGKIYVVGNVKNPAFFQYRMIRHDRSAGGRAS